MMNEDILFHPATSVLPDSFDSKFLNENSLFNNMTYKQILNCFIDDKHTIYRNVTFKKFTSICFDIYDTTDVCRTTLLLELFKLINYGDDKITYIVKSVLKYTPDINLYHPEKYHNSLITLNEELSYNRHPEIIDLLLKRKEVKNCHVVKYLSGCFHEYESISAVLELFEIFNKRGGDDENVKIISETLFKQYISSNEIFSIQLINRLLCYLDVNFPEMLNIFQNIDKKAELINLIPLIDWRKLHRFDYERFTYHIKNIFQQEKYYVNNSHGLLKLYNTIVKNYKISLDTTTTTTTTITIPSEEIILNILLNHRQPEQIILLECMNKMEPFRYLLDPKLPISKYLRKRYKVRYMKFILFWKHKTYRPNSKFYKYNLLNKYSILMNNKPSSSYLFYDFGKISIEKMNFKHFQNF